MKEAEKIIKELQKRLKLTPIGLFFDVMELSILGNDRIAKSAFGIDEANAILEQVKIHFQNKGYSVTYSNGFFSTWMHGEITITKK